MRETKLVVAEKGIKAIILAAGAILAYKAHFWAFGIAAAERYGKVALGGELLVVPVILLLTYWLYKKVEKYFDKKWAKKQNALTNIMRIHEELKNNTSASKRGIIVLNGDKVTSYKNVNGEIVAEECADLISVIRNM